MTESAKVSLPRSLNGTSNTVWRIVFPIPHWTNYRIPHRQSMFPMCLYWCVGWTLKPRTRNESRICFGPYWHWQWAEWVVVYIWKRLKSPRYPHKRFCNVHRLSYNRLSSKIYQYRCHVCENAKMSHSNCRIRKDVSLVTHPQNHRMAMTVNCHWTTHQRSSRTDNNRGPNYDWSNQLYPTVMNLYGLSSDSVGPFRKQPHLPHYSHVPNMVSNVFYF